ncbi:hypothetical protein AMECASPLE_005155 [Ameca splendens]|uniref:Uncharacterized protein n=1 Tax=Ameca splendens TaxID=208324 RepID=A0ABV1A6N3_9TELE
MQVRRMTHIRPFHFLSIGETLSKREALKVMVNGSNDPTSKWVQYRAHLCLRHLPAFYQKNDTFLPLIPFTSSFLIVSISFADITFQTQTFNARNTRKKKERELENVKWIQSHECFCLIVTEKITLHPL